MLFCIWLNLQFWETCLNTNTTQNVLEPRPGSHLLSTAFRHALHNHKQPFTALTCMARQLSVDKTTLYIARLSALCVMLNRRRIRSRRWVCCETWLLSWTKQSNNSGNVFKIYLLAHTIPAQCTSPDIGLQQLCARQELCWRYQLVLFAPRTCLLELSNHHHPSTMYIPYNIILRYVRSSQFFKMPNEASMWLKPLGNVKLTKKSCSSSSSKWVSFKISPYLRFTNPA